MDCKGVIYIFNRRETTKQLEHITKLAKKLQNHIHHEKQAGSIKEDERVEFVVKPKFDQAIAYIESYISKLKDENK